MESHPPQPKGNPRQTWDVPQALTGTKLKIAEAALETLKRKGFAGASAREIGRRFWRPSIL